MEFKEHLFLFLPFLAFSTFLLINLFKEKLNQNESIKKQLALISLTVFILGLLIAFMGILISGAVNK